MKFLNKILFEQKIRKIKSESLRNYFLTFLSVKQIITKLILFLLISLIVITSSFTARDFALKYWSDQVVFNKGIAFSGANSLSPAAVMAIQGIPAFIALIAFIFVNNSLIYIPLIFIGTGGLCNFIDRFIDDPGQTVPTVVDYIHLNGSIANLQDVIVVTSSVIFGVNCVILLVMLIIKESKKEKAEEQLLKEKNSINSTKMNI